MTGKPNIRLKQAVQKVAPELCFLLAMRPKLADAVHVLRETSRGHSGRPTENHDAEVLAMLAYELKTGITAPKTLARYVVEQMETIPPSPGGEQCTRLGNRLVSTDSAIGTLVTHFKRRAPVFRQAMREAELASARIKELLRCRDTKEVVPAGSPRKSSGAIFRAARRVVPPSDPAAYLLKIEVIQRAILRHSRQGNKPGA